METDRLLMVWLQALLDRENAKIEYQVADERGFEDLADVCWDALRVKEDILVDAYARWRAAKTQQYRNKLDNA